jgi:frataxin-like iron-binding protein CyaY
LGFTDERHFHDTADETIEGIQEALELLEDEVEFLEVECSVNVFCRAHSAATS